MSVTRAEDRDSTREPDYHRAEALLLLAEHHHPASVERTHALAAAQVHATLAGPGAQILNVRYADPRYDELRSAVREALEYLDQTGGVGTHAAARLRELIGGAP